VNALDLQLAVPREGGNAGLIFVVQMFLIFAIFYFLLIRPQAKERRRHEEMLRNIKKGDEIVTSGGLIGTIVHVDENRLTLRTGENTRVTVDRSRVASVLSARGEHAAGAKGEAKD
jgi:preprotein translocase subunit YajC